MPASAVARRTPAITGMSGTFFGASGETAEDIAGCLGEVWICRCPAPLCEDALRAWGRASGSFRYSSRHRSDSKFLLLGGRRHLAVGGLRRVGRLGVLRRVGRRLVRPLDLGFGAELGD